MNPRATRIGLLAPMEPELAPFVRRLELTRDGDYHRGRTGEVEVLALLTTMGMSAGERAAEKIIGEGVDRVIVAGVAGGVDPATVERGSVVVPETVIDRRTGRAYGPPVSPDITPYGTISCGDELLTDAASLAALGAAGVIAVDMETAAVAAVCEEARVPWSTFRGISDYAGEGLVDQGLFEATRPDGTPDPDAMARYLEEHPEKIEVLTRLAQDFSVAIEAVAEATIRSFTA